MTGSHQQPGAAEEKYACTRYCTWVHLFGNAYQCHTHNQLHVCDQNCRQLVPATATTSVCRLSKKMFTTSNAGMDVDAVKRKATARGGAAHDEHQHIKRTNSGVR